MPTHGLIYFRDKTALEGWSEAIYIQSDDVNSMMTLLINTLIPLRAQFLSTDCEMHAARASFVGTPRKSYLNKFPAPVPGSGVAQSEQPGDCIEYLGHDANRTSKRQFPFRGCPYVYIDQGVLSPRGQSDLGLYDSYMRALIAGGGSMLVPPYLIGPNAIIGTSKAGNTGPITILFRGTGAYQSGDVIKVKGVRQNPLFNGTWKVQAAVADVSVDLQGSGSLAANVVGQGTIGKIGTGLSQINLFGFDSVSFRKTGRPFGQPRGRRSARFRRR